MKNIAPFSNLGDRFRYQPLDLFMTFGGTSMTPVVTGGNPVWIWPDGVTTSTGETPSPPLTQAGRYQIQVDRLLDITAIDATADDLIDIEINGAMSKLAALTLPNNANLLVDGIVDTIYGFRRSFPAMTVDISGTCPNVAGGSIGYISILEGTYGHAWNYNNNAFQFTVKTDNTGPSNNDQFTIPLFSGETYNFTVYYDGTSTPHTTDSPLTLTFPSGAGTYDLAILGTFPRIRFNDGGDKLKMTGITQFGDVGWGANWAGAFFGCSNLIGTFPTDAPDNMTSGEDACRRCSFTGNVQTLPASLTNGDNMFRDCDFDGIMEDQSHLDGILDIVVAMFYNNPNLGGQSQQFWNWTTPPTGNTNSCYGLDTSLTDYATIPAAYGGGGA